MHCLGAVAGGSSSSGLSSSGSRGGVLSVVRALGVLVCEGRIQGSPRGYKEGPHCAAPQQSVPNHHHVCDKDDYLCNRYLVLVREIADRISIGANLCVEVFMCSECPCGRATVICNNPVSLIPSTSITPWHQSCEMLLEYWCIGVVPSKSSEMMNSQGLYQAVRSRLHFSQVAAWWSRSKGTKPAYIATRVIPYNADNLSKFRETPVEHTFPLASIGDGNSVEVTVWALPRMEAVPTLMCPVHLAKDIKEEECTARALTPTKNIVSSRPESSLVLPVLVDDRLQTPCNQPGKHHCRCEDEDGCPPSPSIKSNGERKRRRSLPCGPREAGSCTSFGNLSLTSVSEANPSSDTEEAARSFREKERRLETTIGFDNCAYLNTGILERCFKTQVRLEAPEGNEEKRYKSSTTTLMTEAQTLVNGAAESEKFKYFVPFIESQWPSESQHDSDRKLESNSQEKIMSRHDAVGLHHRLPVLREPNLVVNPFAERSSFHESNPGPSTLTQLRKSASPPSVHCTVHLNKSKKSNEVSVSCRLERMNRTGGSKDLSQLMSKLSFPKEIDGRVQKEEGGILDWISKVPGRVLSSSPNSSTVRDDEKMQGNDLKGQQTRSNAVKFKNCNLELSQREFDEVLAVLRARTPSGRRRTPVKTLRKRERAERILEGDKTSVKNSCSESCVCPIHREVQRTTNSVESCVCQMCKTSGIIQEQTKDSNNAIKQPVKREDRLQNASNKADVLLGAILRTSRDRRGLTDISNGTRPRTVSSNAINEESKALVSDELPDSRIVPFEDEKFSPSILNKRLHRFKQLFKKEHEKKESKDTLNRMEFRVDSNHINDSRVKRKFDLVNCHVDISKSEQLYEQLVNETSTTLQSNSHSHSTNYKFTNSNNHRGASTKNSPFSFVNRGNKDRHDNAITIDEDEATNEKCLKSNKKSFEESGNLMEESADKGVPSAIEQERFRRSLENAASMVFHSRTGLPLTSSPAPLRRGSCCFDYDSSLNSVSSKRSALFELNTPPSPGAVSLEEADREIENVGEGDETLKRSSSSRSRPQSHALLGSFEESALNGRLEPVSTVHGFTAEIGASGSFCPKHRKLPVTVFFYTLGDNDKVSTPYLAHLNLGKKGYQVPRSGTIQVTLLNPLGTVVKMFVVLYDLSDMPPRSHTFLRQRTLRDKTLRYLIHLRFMSGKSGRIYLHTDIRIIICRKSDVDTASDFGSEPPKELRSYIHGPSNPKFSPRC